MQLIRSIHSPRLPQDGCALTIGNFDAVHLGHREILRTLGRRASRLGLPSVVMTFDPHPQEYFRAGAACARLSTTATRFFALRECGVDIMLSLKFDAALSRTDAGAFVRRYLAERLRVKHLLIGDDFRFGAKRAGNCRLLAQLATRYGYRLERFDTVKRRDRRISSTRVRELLAAGDLREAECLLGRKYAHAGRVIHGDRRGREWGFPTINLAIRHKPALSGVFAVTVSGLADAPLAGAASLGQRPTVKHPAGEAKTVLEVYLFDYHGNAYGRRVCVEFVEKIRAEETFDDYAALRQRIAEDVRIAKGILGAALAEPSASSAPSAPSAPSTPSVRP